MFSLRCTTTDFVLPVSFSVHETVLAVRRQGRLNEMQEVPARAVMLSDRQA
jgi:hypothetical protein